MPVNIVKEYTNYKRPETTDFFLGNPGEWQTIDVICAVVCGFFGDTAKTVTILNDSRIKNNSGVSWFNLGFDIGDAVEIDIEYSVGGTPASISGTITVSEIENDEIAFTTPAFLPVLGFMTLPGYGSTTSGDIMQCTVINLVVNKKPQGLDLELGHVENSDAAGGNTTSVIDGTNVVRRAIGIDTLPALGNSALFAIGNQSGMAIQTANIQYLASIFSIHIYKVSVQYMMCGVFDDSSNYDDLNNVIRPAYFAGVQCLTDVYRFKFKYVINNPNIFTINEAEAFPPQGNTGGFNENFNSGFDDPIIVDSIVYKDILGATVSKLDYWNQTDVTAIIDGIPNLSNLNTKFTFGFFWLPADEEDYKENIRPFHYNVLANTSGLDPTDVLTVGVAIPGTLQGWGYDGMQMNFSNVSANIVSGKLELKFRAQPTTAFRNFLHSKDADNRKYVLYINTANYAQTSNTSSAITHLLDSGSMIKSPLTVGMYPAFNAIFLEHDIDPEDPGLNYFDGFLEDDMLWRIHLGKLINVVYPLLTISNFKFTKFEYAVEAVKTSDGTIVNLESFPIDVSVFPYELDGTHLINYVASRNFKYVSGNYRNRVSLERDPANDILIIKAYKGFYGLKMRWEDWIAKTGIPADFVDPGELNNGQNNDWLQKFATAGWTLHTTFYTTVVDGGGDEYRFRNPYNIAAVRDYDSNALISKFWLYKRFSDNSVLNIGTDPDTGKQLGAILQGEYTSVECQFNILDLTTWPALFEDSYGTMNLQVWRGSGEIEHRQLSTMTLSEPDNPLKPLPGESYLHWSIPAPNVLILKCLIDPSLLQNVVKFQITARVESIPRLRSGKIMEDTTQKDMEDGTDKILE